MIEILVFAPLIAAVWVGLSTRVMSVHSAQFITIAGVLTSAVLSGVTFYNVIINGLSYDIYLMRWISSGDFFVDWSLRVDSLTAVMLVVVTWVSALVHIYSVGYMSHDPHPQRFMAYLSLFTFFMLMLVTSNNFLQLFVGWEGVGLCSYLLIGFWYQKESANAAAMKAFIVNRVGDFGLALGLFAVYVLFGTLDYDEVFAMAPAMADRALEFIGYEIHALTLICILLFIGCMGKSAQFGLHTWLPDAMEGPTPVSALIHAATMVTAGVFLVARCSPLFEHSELALQIVTVVGAFTCIFAATIALTQNDIKRVIAYSTCSQLGYMFFACGVSAYAAGVFHLMTHGFFKALLFLGAGSVIHAMSDEQDMRRMGGLRKQIPLTFAMMMIGTLAIVGFPPLAGFFSKDMVIESAWAAGHEGDMFGAFAFWAGIFAATLTAIYSWRLIFLTFFGQSRAPKSVQEHVHESPRVMTMPLILLSIGAIFSGYVGAVLLGMVDGDLAFWHGSIVIRDFDGENVLDAAHHAPLWVKLAPIGVGLFGLLVAYLAYILWPRIAVKISQNFNGVYRFLLNKWYIDELYDAVFVRPAKSLGHWFWQKIDMRTIDGFGPDGSVRLSQRIASRLSNFQTGYVYHYAFVIIIGITVLTTWLILEF